MAKVKEKDSEDNESMQSILGKIKSVVSGKEKVVIEDDKPEAPQAAKVEDEEPMELTEVVESESEQVQNPDEALQKEATAETAEEEESFVDILQEIDQALETQYKEAAQQPAQASPSQEPIPEPVKLVAEIEPAKPVLSQPDPTPVQEVAVNANVAQEIPQNAPIKSPEVKKEFPQEVSQNILKNEVARNMAENKPNILSEDIANKSSKAIQNLLNNIPRPDIDSPAFRSATTLEDLTIEMIRPMLKEWLDKNLEAIVRDIVDKEIKKIIPRD